MVSPSRAGPEALVEQLTVLVTSEGRWVLPGSEEFLAAVGDPNPDYDAVGFAVRNLGFIKYQVLDRLVTEIELHPRNVALPALLAVEHQLEEPPTKLFRIKHLDTEWRSEISASAEHTVARLRELCAPPPTADPGSTERFRVEPQDPAGLLRDVDNPLRLLTQKWRASFGQFDSSVIAFAIQHGLLARLMIAGMSGHDNDPVFRFIGAGFPWLDPDYQDKAIGEKLESLPDKNYGAWLSGFYKSVGKSGEPRLDRVTARVKLGQAQTLTYQTRYDRLLLPWRSATGETFVSLSARKLDAATTPSAAGVASANSDAKKSEKSS
jgi:hypothetical protein